MTLDGASGRVWVDVEVPVMDSSDSPELVTLATWAMDGKTPRQPWPTTTGPCEVMVAEWWGDTNKISLLVNTLLERDSNSGVVIDLRPPGMHLPGADALLLGVAQVSGGHDPKFASKVLEAFTTAKLSGMVVVGPKLTPAQKKAGLVEQVIAETLEDVLSGKSLKVTQTLIASLGGEKVFARLTALALKAGEPLSLATDGTVAEYELFKRLGQAA